MEKNYKFANVTDRQLKQMGVQALADRPNAAQQYGQSGLSATQLKQWFDKLAELLSGKVNELQNAINGEDAAKYIGLALTNYKTLDALIEGMRDGTFAEDILKLKYNENDTIDTLQNIVYNINQDFSKDRELIEELQESKVSKEETTGLYRRAYGVGKDGSQTILTVSEAPVGNAVAAYSETGALKSSMSAMSLPSGWGSITAPGEVVTTTFISELQKHIGAGVKFSMNPENYVISIEVTNIYGQPIYKTELDLPLENLIIGGRYENGKIILNLKNGEYVEVPVENLVNGLVTTAAFEKETSDIKAQTQAMFEAYIVDVNQLVGGDYVDYS